MKQITSRKSPLTFSDKEVSETAIAEILQNASWASSSYNNQPWYFISVFRKEKKVFQAVLDTLVPANQEWAGSASCFIVNLATSRYSNGKENKFYTYELGMAVANYVTLAMDKGIYCHQMAGFSKDKLEKVIKIPAEYEIISISALGFLGDESNLTGMLAERANAPRERKKPEEYISKAILR